MKRLVPDVPVHGYIAFTGNAEFTKGVPSHVVLFAELTDELEREYAQPAAIDAYLSAWDALKARTIAQYSQ